MQATAKAQLTCREADVLNCIRRFLRAGNSVTAVRLQKAMGFESWRVLMTFLRSLRDKGYIKIDPARANKTLSLAAPDTFTCPQCGCRFCPAE